MAKEGPVKSENANRRVRGLLGGKWIFDTLDAEYVWEHQYCKYLTSAGPESFSLWNRRSALLTPLTLRCTRPRVLHSSRCHFGEGKDYKGVAS